jgi:NitT/TauT family transport system substrate-binding protein/sulfonate transport system substrate-binding protein
MERILMSLLRGICQMPAYVAKEKGFFVDEGLDVEIETQPTAWMVPERLRSGTVHFAVIPWTRVAAASGRDDELVLICGSGYEEAAVVVRSGLELDQVRTVAVPQPGGIKDLTANGLMRSLGWDDRVKKIRQPSGDGAILTLVGQGADAAAMVEPYATMLQELGIGYVARRTGDLWPGAPGCALTTSRQLLRERPDMVRRVVAAFVRGSQSANQAFDEAATIGGAYIGVSPKFVRAALNHNRPNVEALDNQEAMNRLLDFMKELGYIARRPTDYAELKYQREAVQALRGVPATPTPR